MRESLYRGRGRAKLPVMTFLQNSINRRLALTVWGKKERKRERENNNGNKLYSSGG